MGRLQAQEMAEHADLNMGLYWHLTANHYPPIPAKMAPACEEAIKAVNEGDSYREIQLPEGVKYAPHGVERDTAPAGQIVEFANLQPYITVDEWYYE